LLFLEYIGQASVQPGWAIAAPRVTNKSTDDDAKVKEMDVKLDGHYTLLKDTGYLFVGAPPYPFHARVRFRWRFVGSSSHAVEGRMTWLRPWSSRRS
jgi:multiple sugar transport system substrate-binding protein